jgi:hypothetical protein
LQPDPGQRDVPALPVLARHEGRRHVGAGGLDDGSEEAGRVGRTRLVTWRLHFGRGVHPLHLAARQRAVLGDRDEPGFFEARQVVIEAVRRHPDGLSEFLGGPGTHHEVLEQPDPQRIRQRPVQRAQLERLPLSGHCPRLPTALTGCKFVQPVKECPS